MKKSGILFILTIFCLILASPVWAEFTLKPSISLREEYDDNIFLTSEDEEELNNAAGVRMVGTTWFGAQFSLNYIYLPTGAYGDSPEIGSDRNTVVYGISQSITALPQAAPSRKGCENV